MVERGQTWSDNEIARLLDIRNDGNIQAQLLGAVRSSVQKDCGGATQGSVIYTNMPCNCHVSQEIESEYICCNRGMLFILNTL